MTRRGTVLGLLLVAGLLGLVGAAQSWFSASGPAAETISFSGTEATGGLAQALAAVVLAGVLLTLVLAVRGRRVVAVLLAGCGLAMLGVGVLRTPPGTAAVRTRFRQVSLTDQFTLAGTGWPWLYAAAGLLVLVGAVLLFLACPGWARRTRRFDRAPEATPADLLASDDPAGAWRALDAGLDPTSDPTSDPQRPENRPGSIPSFDPDVRSDGAADTMATKQGPSPRRQNGDR